jgi:hypothetical protein
LTLSQIASLFYSTKKDGQTAKTFPRTPRPGQIFEMVPGYDSARQIVLRMVDSGEVKLEEMKTNSGKRIRNIDKLAMFPKDKPPSVMGWQHEIDRGDVYVALHRTGKVTSYRWNWHIDEYRDFAKNHRLSPDGRFELEGSDKVFFLEVDRGTEFWTNELDEKISKYAGLQDSMPQTPFVVLFVVQVKMGMSIQERAERFRQTFKKLGRGHLFVITPHELFVKDPLGEVLDYYLSDEPATLLTL